MSATLVTMATGARGTRLPILYYHSVRFRVSQPCLTVSRRTVFRILVTPHLELS